MNIRKKIKISDLELAFIGFSILSVINQLHLRKQEIYVLAFCKVFGNISGGGKKQQFMEMCGGAKASLGNVINGLKNKGFLVKKEGKYTIHDFFKANDMTTWNIILEKE